MIRYSLRCDQGHEFEGWFRSARAFDAQIAAGQVSCGFCGSVQVEKALMAPSVPRKASAGSAPPATEPRPEPRPEAQMVEAIARLRAHVEANSDYVGTSFSTEARAMHEGRSPARAIHGEARADEARALIEDGIPVAPLPFRPRQKTN